jgi:hypothetical protein
MFNKISLSFRVVLFSASIFLFCGQASRAQNLILNGDFESDPHDTVATILDWTIGDSGFVHSAMEGATSGSYCAALSIGSDSQGNVLSQSFATTVGQSYLVEFDSGVFGIRTGGPLQLNLQLLLLDPPRT